MPQERNSTKSKIPVMGKPSFPSKKSYTENLNPEVKNKQVRPKSKPKTSKQVPACPDGDRRRHLSVVDTNTREGGKSSVSDVEGDVFYTAPREGKYDKETKGRKLFPTRGSKEKQDAGKLTNEEGVKSPLHRQNALTNTSMTNSSVVQSIPYPIIQLQEDIQEPLPEGVINIEVDDGLYEYSREVVVYLKEMELTHLVPTGFLEDGSITPNMRSILVDWIIQVQHHLKLCQETLYLAVGILDKVLHRRDVDTDKLQLVGVTALLVASKLEEYYPVDIKKLLHLTENSYTRVEVTRMERTLLSVLEFEVSHGIDIYIILTFIILGLSAEPSSLPVKILTSSSPLRGSRVPEDQPISPGLPPSTAHQSLPLSFTPGSCSCCCF